MNLFHFEQKKFTAWLAFDALMLGRFYWFLMLCSPSELRGKFVGKC
jgi:hypothetical protein